MHDELTEWWNRISLRTKITGVTVLLLTMGLLVAGLGTMAVLRNYLVDEVDSKLTQFANSLPQEVVLDGANTFKAENATGFANPYYLAAVAADGQLIDDNLTSEQSSLRPEVSQLTLLELRELPSKLTLSNRTHSVEWRVLALPGGVIGTGEHTGEQATLVIGLSLSDSNAIVSRYAAIFLFFGLTVVILGGALTRLLVTTTFTPLREVEATAARFADGDFNQRLAGAIPNTEVGRLNRSLNSMLARIDRAFADRARTIEQMRRFVGDASHELRTPLVSVRGYAELYRMGALTKPEDVAQAMERIEKEAIRMGELVEDLLELARIDEAKPLQLTEVDLVPLATDSALDAMASAPDRVVTVVGTDAPAEEPPVETLVLDVVPSAATTPARSASLATGPIAFASATLARLVRSRTRAGRAAGETVTIPEPPPAALRAIVLAEENKIRQVLANLIGNAMRFTPEGSPIEIGVGVDAARRVAILSVIDHGEGIPPQIRGKIFERFWRADSSRTRVTGGSGLGLAIVAAIVDAHRGEVEVVETPGGGATFRVLLPLLPAAADSPKPTPAP
ncbi:MAG: sensor histidine kinase [Rhodoglobus sp.]|nr:sensor histidine kinase [Rhodoglobus sp.]